MLRALHLKNVGPAPAMDVELAPRLNLFTGDNGLGKSFLLDVAWWALSGKWPQELNGTLSSGYPAVPRSPKQRATISFGMGQALHVATFSSSGQEWQDAADRPSDAGLVIYALGDGGFAVWDPARNALRGEGRETLPGYVFEDRDVWNGLTVTLDGRPTLVCNGLIADWASWIRERGANAQRMADVLRVLTAVPGHSTGVEVGADFERLSLNDARDIPTIRMEYGQDVPIVHAAFGIRRVAALAYVLCWAWQEHRLASKRRGQDPTDHVVLLFDEVEAHLHPRWQRAIVPALLRAVETLDPGGGTTVQVLAATHSPLVLASVEPLFDTARDQLFTFAIANGEVQLHEQPWAKQGDVVNWLVSDSFGLDQGRSIEAERAIEAAEAWMRGAQGELPSHLSTQATIHAELQRVLAGHDPFWPRWIVSTAP